MASEAGAHAAEPGQSAFQHQNQIEDDPFLVPKRPQAENSDNGPPDDALKDGDVEDDAATDLQSLLPAPLSHATFSSASFDVNAFLLSRRHTPLDELRSELRAYLANLRTELVGVINRDYEDFIGLGIGLRGTDKKLERMRRPVDSVKASVESLRNELAGIKDDVESKLQGRSAIREREATLRLLLSIHDSVLKVEALLLIPSPEAATAKQTGDVSAKDKSLAANLQPALKVASAMQKSASQTSNSQRIERVAAEYNHMLYLVRKADGMQYIKALQPRLDHISTTLHQDLTALLSSLLTPSQKKKRFTSYGTADHKNPSDSLAECLRTYLALNRPREAEEVVRRELVRPWVDQHITREALSSGASSPLSPRLPVTPAAQPNGVKELDVELMPSPPSTSSSSQPLVDLYNKVLIFIAKDCGPLLDIAERRLVSSNSAVGVGLHSLERSIVAPSSSAAAAAEDTTNSSSLPPERTYHILANVIWPEVSGRLASELGQHIFASGRPDAFHANYMASREFVSRIESFCPTVQHLQHLRNHDAYTNFEKRWQLSVYFQLRLKEIVGRLEESLASRDAAAPRANDGDAPFLMSATEASHRAIWTSWQPHVLIPDLTPRFWRLTLQIVSRYRTWLDENTSSMIASGRQSVQEKEKGGSAPSSQPPSRTGTPQPAGAGNDVSDDKTVRQLTAHVVDVRRLASALSTFFDSSIQESIPQPSSAATEDAPQPKDLFQSSLETLSSSTPRIAATVVSLLVKACADPLKSVKPMGSQIRASNRKTGAEPSYFVSNILRPLREYCNGPAKTLEENDRQEWIQRVINEVASRYAFVLADLRKVEDSLRKLKKGKGRQGGFSFFGSSKPAPSNEAPSEAEEDRVMVQMRRDVEAFLADASDLGLSVDDSKELQNLRKEVEGSSAPSLST